jgi:hypothetical protein
LRKAWLLSELRVWTDLGLGITWVQRGDVFFDDDDVVLYHATSSSVEVGVEAGRSWYVRPFLSLRLDAPWFRTEHERLRQGVSRDGESAVLIEKSRSWTPAYSLWGGVAF